MSMNDELERRIRDALTTPRASDRVDADEFLATVHRGARIRRVKRQVSVTLATALLVAGGGVVIGTSGILSGSKTPVAGSSSSAKRPLSEPSGDGALGGAAGGHGGHFEGPVTIHPSGPIPARDVTPVSLTATGSEHQWVLAETPRGNCGSRACATVFSTEDHGSPDGWSDLGQLPVTATTGDDPTAGSVSALRFTKRTDGSDTYDGWAYGGALWSTHDSGHTWSAKNSPPGRVTQLESWGDFVYAGISAPPDAPAGGPSAAPGTTSGGESGAAILYRSPTTSDDWQPVDVGQPLTDVIALAAAQHVVGLIDSDGVDSTLYASADGVTWEPQQPCPDGMQPRSLSAAGDMDTDISSLWVTCSDVTSTIVRYMDTNQWGTWSDVQGQFGAAVSIAARTNANALAAGSGILGIQSLSPGRPPVTVYDQPVGAPVFFGFTNARYGYLLDSSGQILSTTDRGRSWSTYAVGDTAP